MDIQTVETHPLRNRPGQVPAVQPVEEFGHIRVCPHPGRPAIEMGQNAARIEVLLVLSPHPAVDPPAVRPITLDTDPGEAVGHDEPTAQFCSPPVKF